MPGKLAVVVSLTLSLGLSACEGGGWLSRLGLGEAAGPAGPPRCEPDAELALERSLKAGWRALAERDRAAAQAAFAEVISREPNHPEALRGLALLDHPAPCEPAD